MISRFNDIDTTNKKVSKIMLAAYKEFGSFGIDKASLNNILKQASTSKGVFYHYFKDKEELYNFLIFHTIKISVEEMEDKMNWDETDFLKRVRESTILRMNIIRKYPYAFDFFKNVNKEKIVEYKKDLVSENNDFRRKFYEDNLNFKSLKNSSDKDKIIKLTRYTIRGITQVYTNAAFQSNQVLDIDEYTKEIDTFLDFIRETFYIM